MVIREKETPPTSEAQPLVVSVRRAAQLLGVSKNFAYRACASGQIPCVRIGGRILVPISALEEFLRVKRGPQENGDGSRQKDPTQGQ